MRPPGGVALGVLVSAVLAVPLLASTPIDEMIASINQLLAGYTFTDHAGQVARTSIKIDDGVLVVETAKRKGADVFTNEWRTPVKDLDADDMRVERVGGHTELIIASRASVMVGLRAMTGGVTNDWSLPPVHAVIVRFQANAEDALDIRDRMAELVLAAQAQTRGIG